MKKYILLGIVILITICLLASCASVSSPSTASATLASDRTALWTGNTATLWEQLQHISSARLAAMQSTVSDPTQNAWIQLALISKRNSTNTAQLARELLAFRERNPTHPANALLPNNATLNQLLNLTPPKHIALLLPLRGTFGSSGQMVRDGFLNAYYTNLPKIGKQGISFYDTTQTEDMRSLYQQAIAEGADFIIGPLIKNNVQQLSGSGPFSFPTLALNYTDIRYGSLPANFYEFGLLPEDEATQIADRAREAGLSHAIVIAPQTPLGTRIATAFSTRFQRNGGNIQEAWYYTPHANFNQEIARLLKINLDADKQLMKEDNNKDVLEKQRRQDFDVIFLFSQPKEARVIVPLLRYYYANNIPIYATSAVYSGRPNPAKDVDLNGVIVCDIPQNMQTLQKKNNNETQPDRLYAVGQDAYLLTETLPQLIQLPSFPLYGKTGALTLASTHQIHRRLPCVKIENGLL